MAKKAPKDVPVGQLGDWGDKYPEAVQTAADEYDKAHTAKGKATGKLNTAKDNLISAMKKHEVKRVRIRNGEKFLVYDATDKIKYEKPAEE